ncbi:MAG: hypothetical protein M3Q08_00090 [Pseudomonadota bacterium]|nr:hypothetical protein [Pseudomonadota bacterium]
MSEEDEARREIIRRLFYLITVAAEDAATMAAEGQSRAFPTSELANAAVRLRAAGEMIEIVASAIEALAAELPSAPSTQP